MNEQRRARIETIRRADRRRSHLWGQMLEAFAQVHECKLSDTYEGFEILDAELKQLCARWERSGGKCDGDLDILRPHWHEYRKIDKDLMVAASRDERMYESSVEWRILGKEFGEWQTAFEMGAIREKELAAVNADLEKKLDAVEKRLQAAQGKLN